MDNNTTSKNNFLQDFVAGARNGFNLSFNSMLPNVLFAFAMIRILNLTGLTDIIAKVFGPVMGVFGLPGISATVVIAGILSTGGGVGAAAGLATSGDLGAGHVAILLTGLMLFGSLVQYTGRILGLSGIKSKHYPFLIATNLIVGFLGMFIAQFFVWNK